jgi:hypothetical protein
MGRLVIGALVLVGLSLGADAGGQERRPVQKRPNPLEKKPGTKKPGTKHPGSRVHLADFKVENGAVVELGVVTVGSKTSTGAVYQVTRGTRFIFVDGTTRKTLNPMTVLTDPVASAHFHRNSSITVHARERVAQSVTFGPKKKATPKKPTGP